MKKTATITFHASHNYGSMLQAYALQQTLLSLGVENDILNFRTPRQKEVYRDPRNIPPIKGFQLKNRIKAVLGKILYKDNNEILGRKYDRFENFITNQLKVTNEFESLDAPASPVMDYDYYIA
ncbi:MAG: polysaccharide pyruvyl transferase family protein, partial [Muribaculaceae bacterium]|nr:polysaccharide pyruvyl transferase family protein [Muribaculaceae bacterium]